MNLVHKGANMSDLKLEDLQSEIEKLKGKLDEVSQERDALKAAAGQSPPDLEGLKNNRDEILAELKTERAARKKLEAEQDKFKTEQEKEKKKALLEQEKFKDLYELELKEKENLKTEMVQNQRTASFERIALEKGINPRMLKYAKAEINQIEFDEESHEPKNADVFFTAFKENYPQFFNSKEGTTKPTTDSAQPNLTGTQQKPLTREEIARMSSEEWKKREAEIDRLAEEGLIQ